MSKPNVTDMPGRKTAAIKMRNAMRDLEDIEDDMRDVGLTAMADAFASALDDIRRIADVHLDPPPAV